MIRYKANRNASFHGKASKQSLWKKIVLGASTTCLAAFFIPFAACGGPSNILNQEKHEAKLEENTEDSQASESVPSETEDAQDTESDDIQATEDSSQGDIEEMRESLACSYAEEGIADELFHSEPSELGFHDTKVAETDGEGRMLVTSKAKSWTDFVTAAMVYLDPNLSEEELNMPISQLEEEGKIDRLDYRYTTDSGTDTDGVDWMDVDIMKRNANWGQPVDKAPSPSSQDIMEASSQPRDDETRGCEELLAKEFVTQEFVGMYYSHGYMVSPTGSTFNCSEFAPEDDGYGRYLVIGKIVTNSVDNYAGMVVVVKDGVVEENRGRLSRITNSALTGLVEELRDSGDIYVLGLNGGYVGQLVEEVKSALLEGLDWWGLPQSLEYRTTTEDAFARALAEIVATGVSIQEDGTLSDNANSQFFIDTFESDDNGRYLVSAELCDIAGNRTGNKVAMVVNAREFVTDDKADSYMDFLETPEAQGVDCVYFGLQFFAKMWEDDGKPLDIYVGPTFYTDEDDEGAIIGDLKQKAGWGQPYNQAN